MVIRLMFWLWNDVVGVILKVMWFLMLVFCVCWWVMVIEFLW